MHGEVRCKARIILILALAKWQVSGGDVFVMTWVIGGLYAKYPSLTLRSEGRVSLLSVKIKPSLPTETLDPHSSLSTHTTLSLSPSCTPQPKPGGGSSRAPPQPRTARAGAPKN